MSVKLSTGLRNFLLGEGSFRKAFEDSIVNVYSGTAPSDPDAAPTGTLLCKYTKSSGAVAASARSSPSFYTITIAHAADTPDVGDTVKLLVDTVAFEYAATASENTVEKLAIKVAQLLNDLAQVVAVPSHANGLLYVQGRYDGVDITIAENTSTGGLTVTVGARVDAVAINSLKFLAPSAGAITKNADTWSGVCLATGTAGYFRLVTSLDGGILSTTDVRLQGNVSTSGSDLDISNVNLTIGATETIDTFTFTMPAA